MKQLKQLVPAFRAVLAGALAKIAPPALALTVVAGVLGFAADSQAQTPGMRFRAPIHRVTVPLGYTGTYVFTNTCTATNTALASPARFDISGLPSGVTYSITATNGALALDGGLPSSSISTNLLITLTFDGTESQGLTTANLNASSGAVNNWSFGVQVAALWSGANYLAGVNTNWNNGGNWVSGSAPGVTDDVVFGQSGATNAITLTNVIVTAGTTISSLRFAPTNSTFKFYNLMLNDGVTLAVNGAQGFSVMKDVLNAYSGLGGVTVTMRGEGGTLAVTNPAANFLAMVDNAQASSLDFSGLGNFVANVNQVGIGNYQFFPNYRNWNDQNSYGGVPRQFLNSVNLARTNVIRTAYADPFNSANADDRRFGFSYLNTEIAGSTAVQNLNLGISNIFYVDSINFGGGNSRGNAQFNSIFAASNPIAIFRGTNGGRVQVFAIADGAGTNTSQTSPNNNVNFSVGTVDILADRLFIGRDRKLIPSAQNPSYQGNFFMARGTVDANTVILGFREYNQTNAPGGQISLGYCQGRIFVTNTAVFKANNYIWLGNTVANHPNEESTGGNTDQGAISIGLGGTVLANNILVGGPAYGYSRNNIITVTNKSLLVVTNFIAGTNQALDFMTYGDGSTLKLTLNATSTVAAVYATNFNMIGSNSFVLAAIKNPGVLTNGSEIPLFKRYAGAAPNFTFAPVAPFNLSGVNGQIVTDGLDPLQQNFRVILNLPKNIMWKGLVNANWDNATKNWLDLTTGLQTNFAAGDNVVFDDTASQFNISLDSAAVILPGSMTMTNIANAYTLNNSGGGSIIGSATLTKYGGNSVTIDATTAASVILNAGSLSGSGTVASVTVNTGASMDFSGTIGGNLNVAGVATSSGTVNGALSVNSGGIVTNSGTMNSTFLVNSGGYFVNRPGASMASIGTASSIATGGAMFNRGNLTGVNIGVSGEFKDSGEGLTTLTGTFTAGSGASIIPGGDGVGTTTIASGGGAGFPGRVLLSSGSTNLFKVDITGVSNTRLLSGFQDFGGSTSVRVQDGATLIITNVTGAFASGQSFTLFQYSGGGNPFPTGASTNRYPIISPTTPGPGLAWDLTQLWPAGVIGVTTNTGPLFTNMFTVVGGTNIIGEFSWDAANYGWRLQSKTVANSDVLNGLNSSNPWTGVTGSWTNTAVFLTNTVSSNNVFYRLTFP
jgi:hypothetical protein